MTVHNPHAANVAAWLRNVSPEDLLRLYWHMNTEKEKWLLYLYENGLPRQDFLGDRHAVAERALEVLLYRQVFYAKAEGHGFALLALEDIALRLAKMQWPKQDTDDISREIKEYIPEEFPAYKEKVLFVLYGKGQKNVYL